MWISGLTFVWWVFCYLMVVISLDKLWTSRMMFAFQSWGHSGFRLQEVLDQCSGGVSDRLSDLKDLILGVSLVGSESESTEGRRGRTRGTLERGKRELVACPELHQPRWLWGSWKRADLGSMGVTMEWRWTRKND